MGLPLRSEIDSKFKWKIEDMFATDELWEQEYAKVAKEVEKESEFKGKLAETKDMLYKALKASDELEEAVEKLYVYANQKYYEDMANGKYQNYAGMAQKLIAEYYAQYSYMEPEILDMSEEKLNELINSDGEIKIFSQYLKNILRQKKHILSAEVENIMANASEMAQGAKDIFSSFNNADIKFKPVADSKGNQLEVSQGRYGVLMESNDRKVRKEEIGRAHV